MDAGRTRVAVIGGGIAGPVAAPAWHRGRSVLPGDAAGVTIVDAAVRTNSTKAAGPVGRRPAVTPEARVLRAARSTR